MTRRDLLGIAVAPISARRLLGASDRVLVGLIGCGGRGRYLARLVSETQGAAVAALCDVYDLNAAAAKAHAVAGAAVFRDFRKLLELKDLDAVLIATPDHWHTIPAVLAMEADKDVYVEKPLAHNVREGRAIVEAARRHKRIAQTGMQHRSAAHFAEAARIVQSGELGEVRYVRAWNFSNRWPAGIGNKSESNPPDGLDWDFYLGPAPWRPFNPLRFLGTYRWFWDYAGGTITDFGTHRFDTVHQIMNAEAPVRVSASGGKYSLKDAAETPEVLQVTCEYPGFVLSYEACELNAHGLGGRRQGMRYYGAKGMDDSPHGMAFYGTNGALFADRIGWEIYPEGNRIASRQRSAADATPEHVRNFLECVRSRVTPNAPVEAGHRAAIVAHLGNIAYKSGRTLRWDANGETCLGDGEASRLLARAARKPWDLI